MSYLFLGGPMDGQRHKVPEVGDYPPVPVPHVQMHEREPMPERPSFEEMPNEATVKLETYLRRELRNGHHSWFIYQHIDDKRDPADAWREHTGRE